MSNEKPAIASLPEAPEAPPADVCIVLEGTYPYVSGGVSSWVHELIQAQPHLTFHLATLLPVVGVLDCKYDIPENVTGLSHIYLQQLPEGPARVPRMAALFDALREPMLSMEREGGQRELEAIIRTLAPYRGQNGGGGIGAEVLLNSHPAWDMLIGLYESSQEGNAFIDYYWTMRVLLEAFYSALLAPLPEAKVYHTTSTGYAGLFAARAAAETGRPAIVTEHGIYTNERRIEIAMAEWIFEQSSGTLSIDAIGRNLKDLWTDTFIGYSRCCYQACSHVLTIYEGNQQFQLEDGADPAKMQVISNGIDVARYGAIERDESDRPPTVALIGRVVPIKDIKTYIRAAGILQTYVPHVQVLVMGPTDEDPEYYSECIDMVHAMQLGATVKFTGRVKLDDYLGKVDVMVLTSISEGQPLSILETGAAGIPTVATDVGACREILFGRPDEDPNLGAGGAITPLSNPQATADALRQLLTDPAHLEACRRTIRARVEQYYDKHELARAYRDIYEDAMAAPDDRAIVLTGEDPGLAPDGWQDRLRGGINDGLKGGAGGALTRAGGAFIARALGKVKAWRESGLRSGG